MSELRISEGTSFFSVVIPVYNSLYYLKKSIPSVLDSEADSPELVVVDNGSTDGTDRWVRETYPSIIYHRFGNNRGFSRAVNEGIKLASGKYILVMNADVLLEKNFFSFFRQKIAEAPQVGMWQPLVLYPEGNLIYSRGLYISHARRFYNLGEGEICGEESEREIFGPAGCCALYKRELLEEVKIGEEYFDEDFFFLLEDFDLAWRARKKGWKAVYYPGVRAYHWGRVTFSSFFRQYLSFRNRYLLLVKNEKLARFLKDLPAWLPYELFRGAFFLFYNPYSVKACREVIQLLPRMRKKREWIEKYQ
ncbi:MAG: glycosyltransferase family 2 protein [Caldiserica bacterium]|nr:glycosyltransferase family 2 protein [Caldisericota bacterium]